MRSIDKLGLRVRSLFRRGRVEHELDEELRYHIERQIELNAARGMSPADALAAAMRDFGPAARIAEECRDARGLNWFEHFLQDLRYAARVLNRNRAFTAVAVLALALGIGANAAMFSVIDAVLLRPLPFPHAGRLVAINERQIEGEQISVSWPDYVDWTTQSHSFDAIGAWIQQRFELTGVESPALLRAARVTSNFFELTGERPALGRVFDANEDRPGGENVVLLGHELWTSRFHSDPNIVGRSVTLSGAPYTVIGIASDGPKFFGSGIDLWMPLAPLAVNANFANRANHPSIHGLARIRPGITVEQARNDIDGIMQRLEQQYPQTNKMLRGSLVSLADERFGDLRPVLLMVFAAVGLILLIATANVANLLLARAVERRKEFAIRTSLGAGRGRVIRQTLTESMVLASVGCAAGVLLARFALQPILSLAPAGIPRLADVHLDLRVLLFCAAVSALSAILFGLAPALETSRLDVNEALSENGRSNTGTRAHRRLRSAFLVAEVALAAMLVVSAGLVVRSLVHVLRLNPGFNPDRVVAVDLLLENPKYETAVAKTRFLDDSLRRLRSLPGVSAAGAVMCPPLAGDCEDWFYSVSDHPVDPAVRLPIAIFNTADPGYFQAMQILLLSGRFFTASDDRQSRRVAIVNQAFVRRWWPDGNAVGQSIRAEKTRTPQDPLEIVGVVGDTPLDGRDEEVRPEIFFPSGQRSMRGLAILVRTSLEPRLLEREIHAVDADLPVRTKSVAESMAASLARRRFGTVLLATFGALALMLAAIGIYGVMSCSVMRRTQEIGIRIAVGATRGDVLRLIVGQGWRLTLWGIALGLAGAVAASRLLERVLFGVSPLDALSYTVVAAFLMLVALIACYLPARRALSGFGS